MDSNPPWKYFGRSLPDVRRIATHINAAGRHTWGNRKFNVDGDFAFDSQIGLKAHILGWSPRRSITKRMERTGNECRHSLNIAEVRTSSCIGENPSHIFFALMPFQWRQKTL